MVQKNAFGHFNPWKMMAALGALALVACNTAASNEVGTPTVDPLSFEKEYVKTIGHKSNDSIKLIGFKKITIPQDELESFDAAYAEYKNTHKNYLWDKSTGTLTVYFPVEAALVEIDAGITEASQLGELDVNVPDDNSHGLSVIGRRQTDTVSGVEGNIIKDGVIYLAEKNTAVRHFDQVFVFDFGIKVVPGHDHHSTVPLAGGQSCMTNHGGKNCSDAYGIHMGRCAHNPSVCMDYNGWFTNCVNGNVLNFPGSDCDYALGAGHCWNEIM